MEDGDDQRRPAASRPTRFGGLVRQASASFGRGGSGGSSSKGKQSSPPEKSNLKSNLVSAGKRLAVSGLTSSLSSQDGEERTGPLYELGSRMKAALKSRRSKGGSTAAELQTNRRLSRRTRNSEGNIRRLSLSTEHLPQAQAGGDAVKPTLSGPMGYMQLRNANMLSQRSESSASAADNLLITSRLLEATRKDNFCDVEIAGKDGAAVKAPSFLLACHSAVFEEMFYPKDGTDASHPFLSQSDRRKVRVEFASQSAIEAVVHFCATLELPTELDSQESGEVGIRTLCQINRFAQLSRIASLSNAAYRAARRMMNRSPHLVCAAFDEITQLLARAESENSWGLAFNSDQDELRGYTLEFLRESPADTIMGLNGQQLGVAFLSPLSIEAIVCDEALDVDEYTVWRILNLWVNRAPGSNTNRIEKARALMAHIQLILIDPDHLKHQVRKCAYVDLEDVEKALTEIESILEKENPEDKERVIVEGAGEERVNGIYVLAEDDIGITRDEALFLKEGDGGEDSHCTDFGLHLWGEQWGISKCTDYFEPLYTCDLSRRKGHTHHRPPKWGWKCVGGAEPAPTCTWRPSKQEEGVDSSDTKKFAPALTEAKVEKNGSTNDVHSSCGHRLKQSLTLSQMMALPEDIGSSNKSLFEYAPAAKDLDTMMNLSVDEGHDDEEAGYNVSYMSAHLCYDPSKRSLKDDKDTDTKSS